MLELSRFCQVWFLDDSGGMMSLEKKYADLGIKIRTSFDDKYVQDVHLNIPKKDLAEALDREGEILPVCCAVISEIRDILSEVAKQGGWISLDSLKELVRLMKSHDHGVLGVPELYAKIDPEDCREEYIHTTDAAKFEDALRIIEDASTCIRAVEIFSMEPIKSCYLKSFHASRMLQALRTVEKNLDQLHPPTTQAWAICSDGEIIGRKTNVMIFDSEEEALNLSKEFRNPKSEITVRKIEFDKNGIQFLN